MYTPKGAQGLLMSSTTMGTLQNNSHSSTQGIYYFNRKARIKNKKKKRKENFKTTKN